MRKVSMRVSSEIGVAETTFNETTDRASEERTEAYRSFLERVGDFHPFPLSVRELGVGQDPFRERRTREGPESQEDSRGFFLTINFTECRVNLSVDPFREL